MMYWNIMVSQGVRKEDLRPLGMSSATNSKTIPTILLCNLLELYAILHATLYSIAYNTFKGGHEMKRDYVCVCARITFVLKNPTNNFLKILPACDYLTKYPCKMLKYICALHQGRVLCACIYFSNT